MAEDRDKTVIVPQETNPISLDLDPTKFRSSPTSLIGGPTPSVGISLDIEGVEFDERRLPEGMTLSQTYDFGGPQFAQGYFQSGWEQMGYFIPRIATKVASEVAQMPGYLVGGLGWIANGAKQEDIAMLLDNQWIQAIQSAEEEVKDKVLPVFSDYKDIHGTFFQQIFDPTFWAKEGADGVGFFMAMLVPGQVLKAAKIGKGIVEAGTKVGIGAKVLKPGTKAAKAAIMSEGPQAAAKWIDGGLSAAINTLYEASAEAGETFRNTQVQLAEEFPEMSEEQIRLKAGEAASNVMKGNWAVLLGSNLVMEQLLWNQFGRGASRGLRDLKFAKGKGKLAFSATKRNPAAEFFKQAPKGIISEGFYEEGMQYALSEFYQNKALGELKDPENYGESLGGLMNSYIEGLASTEGQKSVFLGALLGMVFGGAGAVRSAKEYNKMLFGSKAQDPNFMQRMLGQRKKPEQAGLLNLLDKNVLERYSDIESLAKVVDGKIQYEENGQVKLDPHKVGQYLMDKFTGQILKDNLAFEEREGTKEKYNLIKEINDFVYMLPFLRQEGGMEALKAHLDDLAELDAERQKQVMGIENAQSIEEIKTNLLEKANRYKKIVNGIEFQHNSRELSRILNIDNTNQEAGAEYINGLLFAKFQNYLFQDYTTKRINELKAENQTLDENKAAEKKQIKDNNKYISQYEDILKKTNEEWDDLNNSNKIKEGFNDYLDQKKTVEEAAEAAEKAAASGAATSNPEVAALWDELHEVETITEPVMDNAGNVTNKEAKVLHTAKADITLIDPQTGEPAIFKGIFKDEDGNEVEAQFPAIFSSTSIRPNKQGNLTVEFQEGSLSGTLYINNGTTATYNKTDYNYSIEITKTAEEVKNEDSLAVITGLINSYIKNMQESVQSNKNRLTAALDKIKIYEDKLKLAIKAGKTAKGTGRKVFVFYDKAGRANVYMNALELQTALDDLKDNKIPRYEDSIEKYEEKINSFNDNLHRLALEGKFDINDVTEFLESLDKLMEDEKQFIIATRDIVAQKEEYVKHLRANFKGLRTTFFKEVDKATGGTFVNRQEEIRASELDEEAKENLINDLEKEAYRAIVQLMHVPGETRDIMKPILAALGKRAAQVEEAAQDLDKLATSLDIATAKWKAYNQRYKKNFQLRSAFMKAYRKLFSDKFLEEGKVDAALENLSKKAVALGILVGKEEKDSLERINPKTGKKSSASPKKAYRIGDGISNWLKSMGNTDNPNSQDAIRWAGYVATVNKREFGKSLFKTFTLSQVRQLPTDHPIRTNLTFYVGGDEVLTADEITTKEQFNIASNDIKVVLMDNLRNNSPRLVNEQGEKDSTPTNNTKVLYSSLPEATEKTTVQGEDRFSFEEAIEFVSRGIKGKSVTDTRTLAEEKVRKDFLESIDSYAAWREEAKQQNKIVKLSSRNPGKREKPDWNDVDDVVYGNLKQAEFEVVSTQGYVTAFNSGRQRARAGFVYIKTQNRPELVRPKKLGETGYSEQVADLITWLADNPGSEQFKQVEDFLKQTVFFLFRSGKRTGEAHRDAPDFQYRLFLEKARDGNKIQTNKVKRVVFGEQELNIEDLKTEEGRAALINFLNDKYHNFDKALVNNTKPFTEYSVQKGKLKTKTFKEGYNYYLFSKDNDNVVKGEIYLRPAKTTPFLMGQDPQYTNASLNFKEIGKKEKPPKDEPEAGPQDGGKKAVSSDQLPEVAFKPGMADLKFTSEFGSAMEGEEASTTEQNKGKPKIDGRIEISAAAAYGAEGGLFPEEDMKEGVSPSLKVGDIVYDENGNKFKFKGVRKEGIGAGGLRLEVITTFETFKTGEVIVAGEKTKLVKETIRYEKDIGTIASKPEVTDEAMEMLREEAVKLAEDSNIPATEDNLRDIAAGLLYGIQQANISPNSPVDPNPAKNPENNASLEALERKQKCKK